MDKKEIGKRIKLIRENKGLTREEFAKKLNVSKYTIANYEQGQRGSNINVLSKIATALGVSINELIDSDYDKSKYKLEKSLLDGSSDISNLVTNFKNATKEESVKTFRKLIDILDWKALGKISDDDIYEIINSEELYSYINFLFFKKLNEDK